MSDMIYTTTFDVVKKLLKPKGAKTTKMVNEGMLKFSIDKQPDIELMGIPWNYWDCRDHEHYQVIGQLLSNIPQKVSELIEFLRRRFYCRLYEIRLTPAGKLRVYVAFAENLKDERYYFVDREEST